MQRVTFINHAGKRILQIDFSGCSPDEGIALMWEARRIIAREPPASLLTLTTVTGVRFDSRTTSALQDYMNANRPFVKAAAVVGVTGLLKVLLHTVRIVTKRELGVFDNIEAAKEWLAQR